MVGRGLSKRVEALDAREAATDMDKPFLWFSSQSLFAIRFHAVGRGEDSEPEDVPDPLYERDKPILPR